MPKYLIRSGIRAINLLVVPRKAAAETSAQARERSRMAARGGGGTPSLSSCGGDYAMDYVRSVDGPAAGSRQQQAAAGSSRQQQAAAGSSSKQQAAAGSSRQQQAAAASRVSGWKREGGRKEEVRQE